MEWRCPHRRIPVRPSRYAPRTSDDALLAVGDKMGVYFDAKDIAPEALSAAIRRYHLADTKKRSLGESTASKRATPCAR
jgi:hypothetical protein